MKVKNVVERMCAIGCCTRSSGLKILLEILGMLLKVLVKIRVKVLVGILVKTPSVLAK